MCLATVCVYGLCWASNAQVEETAGSQQPVVGLEHLCHAEDGKALAYTLARTFLSEEEFQKEVDRIQGKISEWQKNNDGDAGRYLNDRLIIVALSAAGGEIPKIQRGIIWLAFYQALNQPAPSMVGTFLREHKSSILRLLDGFSWTKASDYVKRKRWREDIAERNRLKALAEAQQTDASKEVDVQMAQMAKVTPGSKEVVLCGSELSSSSARTEIAGVPVCRREDPKGVAPGRLDWVEFVAPEAKLFPLTSP